MNKCFDVKAEWKSHVPVPVFESRPEFNELYWKAWELAHEHMIDFPGMPQTPYMDEAFCDTEIWIWDTCFMSLFCKYAPDVFPGVESLNNFYKVLYGKASLPRVITKNAPSWTGYKPGDDAQVQIHISDNPPLFAWAEYENALMSGDLEHVKDLLLNKQYLQKHYAWIESLVEPVTPPFVRNPSCLINCGDGYLWEGGRSGMDNTPRGRIGEHAYMHRPNNPDMYWIDAIAQQGLAAYCIARLAEIAGDTKLASEWMKHYEEKKDKVNRLYWDKKNSVYYDVDRKTMDFIKVYTPASFWPMTANMSSASQAEGMEKTVNDPAKLGGSVPWVSLSRDDADFNNDNGEYWRGAVWIPTAYAGLKGLRNYGLFRTAHESALKLIEHMYQTFKNYEPHTIWECYNPNVPTPARSCDEGHRIVRPDFCGWSALAPIAVYIEDVIGIHSVNAFTMTVEWSLADGLKGKTGVRNFRFGNVVADLICEDGFCKVNSNEAFSLKVNGKTFAVLSGENKFKI